MSTDDTFIKQQWQDQEALHRFQLISPLLQTGLDDARRLQVSDRLTVKSIVPRVFRKTLSFSWNRLSSSAGKFRNGQLPRSFTFWKQKVLWLPAF